MLESQGFRCMICSKSFGPDCEPCVDHSHGTGTVRGILCHNCNVGLGHFFDKIVLLQSAITYLNRSVNHGIKDQKPTVETGDKIEKSDDRKRQQGKKKRTKR